MKSTPFRDPVTVTFSATSVGLADATGIAVNSRWSDQPIIGSFVGALTSVGAADRVGFWVSLDNTTYAPYQSYVTSAFQETVQGAWRFVKFTKAGNQTGSVIYSFV